MARLSFKALTLALLLTWSVGFANAAPFVLNFDEFGNGSIDNGKGFVPDPGVFQMDPTTNLLALTYALPSTVTPGKVSVKDADGSFGDAINFYNIDQSGFMAYYSDNSDAEGAAADVSGVPEPNGFFVNENANGTFDYVIPSDNAYHGVSDGDASAAPEPTSLTMAGFGIASLLGYGWRRRQVAHGAVS